MIPKRGFSVEFFTDGNDFERLEFYNHSKWRVAKDEFLKFTLDKRDGRKRIAFVLDCLCEFPTAVSIRFCGLDEMIESNGRFRGKPRPTDVLSFPTPISLPLDGKYRSLGDILISLPVAEIQAREHRHSLGAEVERLLIHGVAHLTGLDHERGDSAWRVQEALEKSLRSELRTAQGVAQWCQVKKVKGSL